MNTKSQNSEVGTMKNPTADQIIGIYNTWGLRNINDMGLRTFAATLRDSHPKLAAKFDAEFERRQTPRASMINFDDFA